MEPKNEISSNKKGLLDRWRRQNKKKEASPGIQRMPEGLQAPLSPGQQRLWFLQQLYAGNPFYHYADVIRLKGQLKEVFLWESFKQLAQKHAILRTTFSNENGTPIQVVGEQPQIEFSTHDIRNLAPEQKEKEAVKLAITSARQAFDLEQGPLTRLALIQMADQEYWLVLSMHHIITDKWSMGILRKELAQLYTGLTSGKPISLPALPIQYTDYSYWQKNQALDKNHLAYWEQKLSGELPVLKLPTDRPSPLHPSFKGAFCVQKYSEDLSGKLKELSKKANTTLFVLLLTAYKVLLHRYSGQEDILVGTPFTNRDQVVLEQLIGFFNDTLVLRSDLSGDPSFLDLVHQMRQTVLEAFTHKNTPFESLVRRLSPDRQMSANPLFQVMFLYHKVPENPSLGPDLSLEHQPFDIGVSKFDLTLYISEEEMHLSAIFEYAEDLFDASTIQRMQGHLQMLLEAIVDNPAQAISSLPILTPPERKQILTEWNNTKKDIPPKKGVHQLFEEHARQHPDRVAAVFQEQELTYKELEERSSAIASYLHDQKVGRGSVVGLYTERSLDMLIGILGILKAGAAYLPLDPEYPQERIEFMLSDARVEVILCQEQLLGALPAQAASMLSFNAPELLSVSPVTGSSEVAGEDLAYIIYTSGSTGRPKGVPVSHHNLLHSTTARFDYYPDQPGRFLLLSSFAFDSSVVGIFWTLCCGGTLVLPEKRIEQDLNRLASLLATHQVTHSLLLPSLYSVLLQHIQEEAFRSLNTVIVAGEACSAALCRQHFELLPEVGLYNEYGPTEASVWCTVHKVEAEDAQGPIPIGRPISNAEIYLLDKNLQPVPVGAAGELYVGGAGVTQGYLNRPELTARHFVSNPFSKEKPARLYRTGDLARYRPDGLIDFLGRADQQVKIRGYRIELDEIKENILQCAGVKDALVIVLQEAESRPRLVAYLLGEGDLNPVAILNQLRETLPSYMVPASLVMLEEWPRLPNGKINRKALPPPGETSSADTSKYAAPRSGIEEQLAGIWEAVLKVSPIGIHDNFFEIGGDSILSIQIIAKARKEGLNMAANQLFEHQTIAELALFVQTAEKANASNNELLTGPTPLTPIQHWFFEEHLAAPHHWNQGISLTLLKPVATDVIRKAIAQLVLHHDALRLRFTPDNGRWKASFIGPEKISAFQHFELNNLGEAEQNRVIEEKSAEVQSSFQLAEGSLFKGLYFECEPVQESRLLLVAHHLVVDAVSWQIIFDDLKNLCDQLINHKPPVLSPKTTSYKNWGTFLHRTASTEEWMKEYDYWQEQLPSKPELPTDFDAQLPIPESSISILTSQLDTNATERLLKEVPAAYNTKTEEVLIAALLLTMSDWAGPKTLHLGLERHGRESVQEDMDLSATVGWFTAFYPLKLEHDPGRDIGESLKSVKEQLRKVPKGGLGYGVLRYLARDQKIRDSLKGDPLVLFNFLGQQDLLSSDLFGGGQMIFSAARDPRSERSYFIEINAFILDGQLDMRWSYSRDLHRSETITLLIKTFETALAAIVDHCTTSEIGGYTPSDFPEADLSQDDLDHLLGQINI